MSSIDPKGNLVKSAHFKSWHAGLTAFVLSFSLMLSVPAQRLNYEGLKVIRIEISVYPSIKESELRPLIVQREAEPYSTDKIRASIAALYATGRFSDIQIDAKPQADGVILTFVLQPTFYIGIIDVTGVEKAFTPNRVIEATNLPHNELYTQDKITDSMTQLDQFFKNNGYFDTKIRPDLQFDHATRRANITFHVQLNRRAKIGRVTILGTDNLDKAHLMRVMKLKPGSKFTAEKLERAQDKLRRDLADHHDLLAASIRLSERKYQPPSNTVDLTYDIKPGPTVAVTTQGAKLSKKRLRKLVPIYEEASYDRDLVEEGRRNIINYYQTKGYFNANVDINIQSNGRTNIDYQIDKGPKRKVGDITFTGNHYFAGPYLSEQIPLRTAHFLSPGVFNEDLLRRSTKNITALYQQHGYEEAKVTDKIISKDSSIIVNFQIEEGPRTLVDSLEVQGNRAVSREVLMGQINLRPQQPFSEKFLVDDRDRVLAFYYDKGFPNARFDFQVERLEKDPHHVRVTYRIDEGNPVRIEQVFVTGNRITKEEYIKDSIDLQSGQPLSLGKTLEEESKLYNLGIFERVEIVPVQPITEQKAESLVVAVREAKRHALSYSLGFEANRRPSNFNIRGGSIVIPESVLKANDVSDKTFLSPRVSFDVSRRNIRGRDETATLGARVSRLQKRGIFTFADPRFWRSDWGSLFTLFSERNSEIRTFTANRFESSFQLERHPSTVTTLQLRYSYRRVGLSNIKLALNPLLLPRESRAARLSTVSLSWIRDTRDRPLDASTGRFLTADFGVTPKLIGSASNFVRFFGQAAHYREVFGSTVWANSVRFGILKPFAGTREIPLSELFYAGGSTSLRGFPTNEAGLQAQVEIPVPNSNRALLFTLPVGGDRLFIINSELRFPLPLHFVPSYKNLGFVLFYDGGNVYNRTNPRVAEQNVVGFVSRGYTNTVGIGLRYKTPVGPLRFDIGRNLNPTPGLSPTQFFITLGQAF